MADRTAYNISWTEARYYETSCTLEDMVGFCNAYGIPVPPESERRHLFEYLADRNLVDDFLDYVRDVRGCSYTTDDDSFLSIRYVPTREEIEAHNVHHVSENTPRRGGTLFHRGRH